MRDTCPLVHNVPIPRQLFAQDEVPEINESVERYEAVSARQEFSTEVEVPMVNEAVERYGAVEINGMVHFPHAFALSAYSPHVADHRGFLI